MKNPPAGFEEMTKRHFELKKDEILKVTKKWVDESIKSKTEMTQCRNELLNLYGVDEESSGNASSPKAISCEDKMDIDSVNDDEKKYMESDSEEEKIVIKKKKTSNLEV